MIKATYWILLVFTTLTMGLAVAAPDTPSHLNLDKTGLALQGYDAVSYHDEKLMEGKREYFSVYEGGIYLFASQANMNIFQNNPETYLPAFGGWCAWAMLDGEKVDIDPATYKIIDGTTYLFYNSFFTNTLHKWNKRALQETDQILIKKAQAKWIMLDLK